jgi:hypothetical protein
MRALVTSVVGLALVVGLADRASAVVLTYQWNDQFYIYGQRPDPHVNGFDYWFSTEKLDSSLAGAVLRIDKIRVTAPGTNLGDVVNFNIEVMLDGIDMTLPEGQFIATHVDPVAGYNFNMPVYYNVEMGWAWENFPNHNNYVFDVTRDFESGTTTAYPHYAADIQARSDVTLQDGLHAQLFFWTGDNRNCRLEFPGATLEVTATVLSAPPTAIPEPGSLLVWSVVGAMGVCVGWWRRRKQV